MFFDGLGPPWPIHDCNTSWTRGLKRIENANGGTTVEVSPEITAHRPPDRPIDHQVEAVARRRIQKPDSIMAIPPGNTYIETITGILRECRVQVDVYETLKMPPSSMAEGFLAELGKGRWGKITIHVPLPLDDLLHSYAAWIQSEHLEGPRSRNGVTVEATVVRRDIPRKARERVCTAFKIL